TKRAAILLTGLVRKAHQQGLQVSLDAAGDKAVRQALDACEKSQQKAKEEELILPEYPCRLEHVELVDRQDLGRFGALGVVASMQPSRVMFDDEAQNYFPNRLGERVRYVCPWNSLRKAGALLSFASDWPVGPLWPRAGLFAAATRTTTKGKPVGGWIRQEKISLEQAVEHYTADPARAIGRDDSMGRLSPGKLADLVVFDRDIFVLDGPALLEAQVAVTIF